MSYLFSQSQTQSAVIKRSLRILHSRNISNKARPSLTAISSCSSQNLKATSQLYEVWRSDYIWSHTEAQKYSQCLTHLCMGRDSSMTEPTGALLASFYQLIKGLSVPWTRNQSLYSKLKCLTMMTLFRYVGLWVMRKIQLSNSWRSYQLIS